MARVTFRAPEGTTYTPLPQGTYDVEFVDAKETVSKSSQSPQIEITGKIVGGAYDDRKVMLWYSLKEKAGWKLRALLDACSFNDDIEIEETEDQDTRGNDINDYTFDTDDLIGEIVRYDVEEGEYNGKPKNDFTNERPAPEHVQAAEADDTEEEEEEAAEPPLGEQPKKQAKQEPQRTTTRRRRRGVA